MAQVQRLYNFANGTKSDAEQVDAEFDNLIQGVNTLDNDLNTHKSSGDHDSRYYTKSQTDTQINNAVANVQASKFVETGTSFPSSPTKGQTFYHETEKQFYIYDGSKWEVQKTDLSLLQKEIANLNLQLEASQRVTNGKTFGTDFLNTFGMTIDYAKTNIQGATNAGVNTVAVTNASPFKVGQEVTIYDDVKLERAVISNISGNNITFTTSLVNSYKDKANVARTMAILDTVNNCLKFGGWATGTTNTVTDATVVASAYDTSGNGGRKLVRLSNGWLVAAVIGNGNVYLYKSEDNGNTWAQLCYLDNSSYNFSDVSIQSYGNKVYLLTILFTTAGKVDSYVIDVPTQTNVNIIWNTNYKYVGLDQNETALGKCSLAINSAGTELHAAWASKSSTHPNSFNIRYAKGTIETDGSVTWGAVEQIYTMNTSGQNAVNPCIILYNDTPYIIVEWQYPGDNGIAILSKALKPVSTGIPGSNIGHDWGNKWVYNGGNYTQSYPSACVDKNGRIWVAWHGKDATDSTVDNIRVSYSDDGGVTWSSMTKLTSGNLYYQQYPSITANKNNEVFIVYRTNEPPDVMTSQLRYLKYSGGTWGSVQQIGSNISANNPSTLYDINLNFSLPLIIYSNSSKVGFYGTWTTGTETPLLENDVRFTVSDTEEVVTWVQRDEGLTVTGYLNGNTMTKTSVTGEDQFTYDLNSVQPAEVKLKMTRANTTDDVKITKILGGVA
jgi:hypothetical protein